MNYAIASAQTYCTGVKLLEQLHYVVRFIKSLRRRVSQRPGCKRQRFFAIFSLLTLFVPSLLLPFRATLSSSFTGRLTKAHVAARSKEDWEAEPATVVARLVFEMCGSAHSIYTKWIRSYWQPFSQWCTHANSIWHPCASNCFFLHCEGRRFYFLPGWIGIALWSMSTTSARGRGPHEAHQRLLAVSQCGNTLNGDFPTFSRIYIFFLLTLFFSSSLF